MLNRRWGNYAQPAIDQNTIIFCQKMPEGFYRNYSVYSIKKKKSGLNESSHQKLFLLSKHCEFPIFDTIPKIFSISTKNSTSHFNLEMLKEVSPVITEHIQKNPTEMQYFLNINDEENVLSKFEQLFLGKTVIFDEDELPSSQRITKMLQIKNCPNYLKPESLRTAELYSNGTHVSSFDRRDIKMGIVINRDFFINYLKSEQLQTFKIKTKKNEYKCNIFGIYSSNVIRQIIEKDRTINEFDFNFDDEDDEFQLICDFFNFKQIDIKSDNMDLLKEFAENLQINCIIKQIDNYINNYEKFSQKIDEQQTIIDSIDNLFDLLYNIKNYGIEKVKILIAQSKWSQTEESVQELAASIIQVIKPNFYLNSEMAELLIQLNEEANESNKLSILTPFIVKKLMTFYMPKPSYITKKKKVKTHSYHTSRKFVFSFIFILYKRGIISKEDIIEKLKQNDYQNKNLNAFFLPEIIELDPKNIDLITRENDLNYNYNFISYVQKYLPDKIDLYKKMLDNMEPDDELTKSIMHDDVDTLQSIITRNEIDIPTAVVPYNIFDDFEINPTILNYSCLYGSLKCFKYLLLNEGKIDESTLYFAIYGGNTEIIKIVDQRTVDDDNNNNNNNNNNSPHNRRLHFGFATNNNNMIDSVAYTKSINGRRFYCINYKNDNNIVSAAIVMHRNDIFDWIFEKRFVSKGKIGNNLNYIASISASNGNAHSMVEIIDKGFDISSKNITSLAASNGFCELTKLLMSIVDRKAKKDQFDLDINSIETFDYKSSIRFENLSIFKLFITQMDQKTIELSIIYAIEYGYKKIIDYYFDHLDEINFPQTINFVKTALNSSFMVKDDKWFVYLMDEFKKLHPEYFDANLFKELILHACMNCNLAATKIITDIILKESPKNDFSTAFINASSSGAIDICRYFISKKVCINSEKLSTKVSELGLIDVDLFSLLLNSVNPNIKFKFLNCIDQAIQNRNKKLIEFLLKEKAPIKNALFEAVKTGDIEIVDIILKYNNKPSYVNQKNCDGTVLHIAVMNKDITMVKRLLSIPGIDPSLYNQQEQNPLTIAIREYDLQIIDLIFDFYGENIQPQIWALGNSLMELSNRIIISNSDIVWKIIIRILKNKSIDPNIYYEQNTFLCRACFLNQFDVVKKLLSIENIDVNKHDINTYDTPLMIAIANYSIEIAELLINFPKTDINMRNSNDKSALILAVENNLAKHVELLIKNERFDPDESKLDYSFYLANSDISKVLIKSNLLDINRVFELNTNTNNIINKQVETTALIHSVELNDVDKIDLIINHPSFDKDRSHINGAIFAAARENNIEIFKKLIKIINYDINIKISKGKAKNLLIVASENLSGDIIDEIFRISQFQPIKKHSILKAFVNSYSQHMRLKETKKEELLQQHQQQQIHLARPNRRQIVNQNPNQNQNQNVLHTDLIPNKSNVIEIMNKIFDYDNEHFKTIDFNSLLPNGLSFFTTIFLDFDEIKEVSDFLIVHGADPNIPDKKGQYPLKIALILKSMNFVESLMNSNKIDYTKFPYLHIAISFCDEKMIKSILDKNLIDVNSINDNDETPLFIACKLNRIDAINLLFEKNELDYLHRNKNGDDALKIIKQLQLNEYNEAIKSKDSYHKKILALLNEKSKVKLDEKNHDDDWF